MSDPRCPAAQEIVTHGPRQPVKYGGRMAASPGFGAVSPARLLLGRIRRRWLLVVGLAIVGAVGAGVWSTTAAAQAWTGTIALTTQSQNRAPDQDAVLALGYVDFFNQDAYQQVLHAEIGAPAGVRLSAKTGATSPVFYIQATGTSADQVRSLAASAADRFRSDVRNSLIAATTPGVGCSGFTSFVLSASMSVSRPCNERIWSKMMFFSPSLQGRLTDIE